MMSPRGDWATAKLLVNQSGGVVNWEVSHDWRFQPPKTLLKQEGLQLADAAFVIWQTHIHYYLPVGSLLLVKDPYFGWLNPPYLSTNPNIRCAVVKTLVDHPYWSMYGYQSIGNYIATMFGFPIVGWTIPHSSHVLRMAQIKKNQANLSWRIPMLTG